MRNIDKNIVINVIIFVIFSVIMFAMPIDRAGLFWISYVFSSLAILSQIYFIKIAFVNGSDVKSKFYGFPIVRISATYLFAQLIFGFIFTLIGHFAPEFEITWLAIIIYIALIGFVLIGTITAEGIREEIERQDIQLKQATSNIKELQAKASGLILLDCKDNNATKEVNSFVEEFKYSDPVSNENLEGIENDLKNIIYSIEKAINDNDATNIIELCKKAKIILTERNRLCKIYK